MGIFTDNPVLEREMRGRLRLRRKGSVGSIPWVGWILAVVIFYFYARGLIGLSRGTFRDSQEFWPLLSYGLLTLIVLLAPALASTAITQEREQQTWDSLATTQLTALEILLGKWLGRQIIPWLLLVIALPYMLGVDIMGRIGFLPLIGTLLFLFVTSAFYGVLGLLCSYQARRTMTATASALTFTALLCIGTLVINGVLSYFIVNNPQANSPVEWLNPFIALSSLMNMMNLGNSTGYDTGTDAVVVIAYFSLTLTLTFAALLFMVSRYRRAVRERT